MDFQIFEKPAFTAVGKALRVSTKDDGNLQRIPAFWRECVADGTLDRILALGAMDTVLGGRTLGICTDFAGDMSEFTYVIAVEALPGAARDDLIAIDIPSLTWARFDAVGAVPDVIQKLWSNIWSDFFPNSGYEHTAGPDIEVYPPGDPMQPNYRFAVLIPVVKK